MAAANIAMLRNTVGGEKLSPEMILLMSLVVDEDYVLFPSAEERLAFSFGLDAEAMCRIRI